jgi:hypothetical protein
MEQQRRTPRFAFSASAEVIRGDSVELTSVTELSLYGCYLASSTQFPRGTCVMVKIFARGEFFEAPGKLGVGEIQLSGNATRLIVHYDIRVAIHIVFLTSRTLGLLQDPQFRKVRQQVRC